MVLKIDRSEDRKRLILQLSGRMQSEHLEQLKNEIKGNAEVVLDLQEVKLVDRDAVRFLAVCEENGAKLRNCSAYIRDWIDRERPAPGSE